MKGSGKQLDQLWWVIFAGLFIYSLVQKATWTLPSFRRGIVVDDIYEYLIDRVPDEMINRRIELNGILFLFISQTRGLFRTSSKLFNSRSGGWLIIGW